MAFNEIVTDGVSKVAAFWVSTARTLSPLIAGYVIQLLAGIGVAAPEGSEASLAGLVFLAISGLWYVTARFFEEQTRFSWLSKLGGIMLGIPKPPAYASSKKTATDDPQHTEG